jgi:hypothetical protein
VRLGVREGEAASHDEEGVEWVATDFILPDEEIMQNYSQYGGKDRQHSISGGACVRYYVAISMSYLVSHCSAALNT